MERTLTHETLVIADSVNNIKGHRYEMYCATRGVPTSQVVLYCETNVETCREWNQQRDVECRYSPGVFDDLVQTFEEPNAAVRWDTPLFNVRVGEELLKEKLLAALYQPSLKRAPLAVKAEASTHGVQLSELDVMTRDMIKFIVDEQKLHSADSSSFQSLTVTFPGCEPPLDLVLTKLYADSDCDAQCLKMRGTNICCH